MAPIDRDWTRREILKVTAAGGITTALNPATLSSALPVSLTSLPLIPSESAVKTSIPAPATG